MSSLNYFQTYSQPENLITNNTLLMLRHVYRSSPDLLEAVIKGVMEEDDVEIGLRFKQQVKGKASVPDAVLSQKALNIYIEAKRWNKLYDQQLSNHMESIADKKHPTNSAFLIGLTLHRISENDRDTWRTEALRHNIRFVAITYSDLLEALETVCANHPILQEIFEDYQTFLVSENLITDRDRKLVAMLCGQSWRENIKFGVYYEPSYRNSKWGRAAYLGVYKNKQVSHVGRIEAVAVCWKRQGILGVDAEESGVLSDEQKDRISSIIDAATYYPNLGVDAHRYYVVDHFLETDLRKASSGGMMGHRYFDIGHLTQSKPQTNASTAHIAATLSGTSFI